jgi:hypothetical protein
MTKKLIDWATAPRLTMTNEGEILSVHSSYAQILHTWQIGNRGCCIKDIALSNLRMSHIYEQPWIVYEEGLTVVPEWAEYLLKVKDYKRLIEPAQVDAELYSEKFEDRVISSNKFYITGQAFAYRIISIKDGWTDNTNEVKE